MATFLGSAQYYKNKAEKLFDELNKEKKVQSQLRWDLEVCALYRGC